MATRALVNAAKPSFKQQNLPAWQPILTAGTVLPTFFLIGVAFVPIGVGLLMASTTVQEKIIDYTDCRSLESPQLACATIIQMGNDCTCKLNIELDQDFRSEVYVYYGLSNFYQNHRRYVKSRDDYQLLGNPKSISGDCYPFDYSKDGKPIAPCGAIANSMFNDSFNLELNNYKDHKPKTISFSRTGIAWSTDKHNRFRNPTIENATRDAWIKAFSGTVKPPNWRKPVYELSITRPENNGFQNEDLIVWMRTAALPTFRKLWAIVNTKESFGPDQDYLPRGNYTLTIAYNYPVTLFNGRKRFIISNTSWLGGKNNFLGIAYIVVGCICFLVSAFFLFIHKKYGRLPSEITQINQTTPYLAR